MVERRDTSRPHGGRRRAVPTDTPRAPRRAAERDADTRTDTIVRPAGRPSRPPGGTRRSSPEEIAASATTSRIPTTPRPRPANAVFVDGSGRRARRLRVLVVLVAALGALFVGVVAASALAGPSGPVGPVVAPAPSTTPSPANGVVEILPTPTRTN